MRSLWARAGQAHRCGCRACSTAVGSVRRRATGVAGRRKATFAEIFTACYSSVFASAAIVDAVRKDDRRKELDRQLEDARRSLTDLLERSSDSSPPEATSSHLTIQQMDSLWLSLKDIYRGRPYMKEIHRPATLSTSELISSLKAEFYNAVGEASLRAMRETDYEQLERDVASEEVDGRLSRREPRNRKQLGLDSLNTEDLVRKLLWRAEIFDNGRTQSPAFDEARRLVNDSCTNFTFPSVDPGRAIKNSSELNGHIRALVSEENLSFKERIGRVCHNLLVSAYPPDMHTYNTLIVAFDKSGYHAFADAVVHSFFHQRLMKPTPSTYVAVLNHYKSTSNHGQFLRVISCIAGLDKWTGAKIRRRHVNDVAQLPILQYWAADTKRRTQTGSWVWEHGPLNTKLVEKMLDGLLHFKLFADAAALFLTCVRSGVALSTRAITHVFDECVAALDWKAAVQMVRGLMANRRDWETLLSRIDEASARYLLRRTSALMDLCGLGNSDREPAPERLGRLSVSPSNRRRFLESMTKASRLFPDTEPAGFQTPADGTCGELLRTKRRLLQVESLWKEYEHVRKTTNSIESKLLYPDLSISFRTSMALHIGTSATRRWLELSHEIENLLGATELVSGQPRVSRQAKKDAETDRLDWEMDQLSVDAKQFATPPEPEPRQGPPSSSMMADWAGKQGHALASCWVC